MSCGKYRKAITEALLSGEELPAGVRSHVDNCPLCRVAFAQEKVLLTAIDKGIRDAVDCEVPGSMQAAVRARIAEEATPKPNWMRTWATVAASAALIIGIVVARNARHSGVSRNSKQPIPANSNSPQGKIPISPLATTLPSVTASRKTTGRQSKRQGQSGVLVSEARPLVPDGQRKAVDELIAGLRRGELKGEVLFSETGNKAIEDLQIAPIEIPAISSDEAPPGVNR